MLVQNLNNKIVCFRTGCGEEVLGKLLEDTGTTIKIGKPISVQLQMMQQGGAAISFAPFGLARDDAADVTFVTANLMTLPAEARDDIRANYIKATTGLDIPTTGQASSILKA